MGDGDDDDGDDVDGDDDDGIDLVKVGGWTCWSGPTLGGVIESASLIKIIINIIIMIMMITFIIRIILLSANNLRRWQRNNSTIGCRGKGPDQ